MRMNTRSRYVCNSCCVCAYVHGLNKTLEEENIRYVAIPMSIGRSLMPISMSGVWWYTILRDRYELAEAAARLLHIVEYNNGKPMHINLCGAMPYRHYTCPTYDQPIKNKKMILAPL